MNRDHAHSCASCGKSVRCTADRDPDSHDSGGEHCDAERYGRIVCENCVCEHDFQEQPGEPPVDVCVHCGEVAE